jgi:hypothetical protein
MTNKNKSVWETLSKVNVNDHTEKKNGLTYLSWAWAWGVLKDNYPDATFEKHVQPNGMPYIMDANGFAYVQVTVTVDGISATELFPVLDYKNKAVVKPDSFAVKHRHAAGTRQGHQLSWLRALHLRRRGCATDG